ncbi:MAG: aldo/keto reductase [Nitrospinae bacterium]|nr:aldo/keto reductase [Nitrospinota bacterium]
MNRRDFLLASGAVAVGLGASAAETAAAAEETAPRIKKYNPLGKTGLKISDISFGAGKLNTPSLVARAVDMGVNYFDTAPDYGQSEANIGKYIKESGARDKMVIASKFCKRVGYPGHLDADAPEKDYIESVEGSLKTLNTDYLDVVFVHAMGEPGVKFEERLLSQNMLNAYEKLKKAGKARFLAVSSHGTNRLEELLTRAVKSGHYDIVMAAFNFMKFPGIPDLLKEAASANVGVIAMKTLAGAKEMNLDPGAELFSHAAFKWVLKNPQVAGLVVTISSAQDLAEYVKASGEPFTKKSQQTLDRYMAAYTKEYCRTGCGDCVGSCQSGVDIPGVLRQWMYFADYHDEKRALQAYAGMNPKADACGACEAAMCESACPYGLPVANLLSRAHEGLSFTA